MFPASLGYLTQFSGPSAARLFYPGMTETDLESVSIATKSPISGFLGSRGGPSTVDCGHGSRSPFSCASTTIVGSCPSPIPDLCSATIIFGSPYRSLSDDRRLLLARIPVWLCLQPCYRQFRVLRRWVLHLPSQLEGLKFRPGRAYLKKGRLPLADYWPWDNQTPKLISPLPLPLLGPLARC